MVLKDPRSDSLESLVGRDVAPLVGEQLERPGSGRVPWTVLTGKR